MPLFSVIVPIYNVERYLEECIESILTQDFKDFEVILVDDGSPDNCPIICDNFATRESRIKVIHKINGGLVSARKAGLCESRGRYIVNVDGDDCLSDGLLSKLSSIINKHSEPDMIAFAYQNMTEFGEQIDKVYNNVPAGYYTQKEIAKFNKKLIYDFDNSMFNTGCLIYSLWSKAIKKEVLVQKQLSINETITNGEDVAVVFPALMNCNSLVVSDIVGYRYRARSNSMVHSFNKKELQSYLNVMSILQKELPTMMNKNIIAYGFRVFLAHVIDAARTFDSYIEFKQYCQQIYNADWKTVISSFQHKKIKINRRISIICLKKKVWLWFWVAYR